MSRLQKGKSSDPTVVTGLLDLLDFKTVTNKRKYQLILAAWPILAFLLFTLAFRPTWEAYLAYQNHNEASAAPGASDFDWDVLRQKERMMAKVLSARQSADASTSEKELLTALSTYTAAGHVTVKDLGPPLLRRDSLYTSSLTRVTLEGTFRGLTEVLSEVEASRRLGKVTAASYHSSEDAQTGRRRLELTLYLETLTFNRTPHSR